MGEEVPEPGAPVLERVRVRHRYRSRRRLGGLFWVAVVLVPVGITAAVVVLRAETVESHLVAQARAALRSEGLTGVRLEATGRSLDVGVPTGKDPQAVVAALAELPGAASVTVERVYADAREAKACAGLQRRVDRVTDAQRIPFEGSSVALTPRGAAQVRAVAELLGDCRPAAAVIGGHTDSSTVNGSIISLERARVVIRLLGRSGVDTRRLEPRGYADQFPVDEGHEPGERARNQRVSVKVELP